MASPRNLPPAAAAARSDARAQAAQGRWVAAGVLAITTGVLTLSAMIALFPSAVAPALARALDVPPASIGLQISLVYAGAMVTSLLGGTWMRRAGACRTSQLALVLAGGGAALAMVPSLAVFALASFLIGLGYGLTNPAASHLLFRFTPPGRRNLLFSLKQTGVPLGGVLAGATAPALVLELGWQWALGVLVVAAAALAAGLQPLRAAWDDDRDPGVGLAAAPLAGIALVWRLPVLRWLSLAGLCFAAVQLSVSAFTVTLLVEEIRFGLVEAGLVLAAVQVAGVTGRLFWGWLADRLGSGPGTLMLASCVTVAAALVTAAMDPAWPNPVVAATLCVLGLAAIGWNGVYLAEVARHSPPGLVATATGGSLFFTFTGVLLGPPAFTAVYAALGRYSTTFGACALVAATGLALVSRARSAARAVDAAARA